MPKIKAADAQLKNAQHFGTDRSLIKKLKELFGDNVTVANIMEFSIHDFMSAGLTGNQTMRVVKYLNWYGHKPKDYIYANKRTKQTNVDMTRSKEPCFLHECTEEHESMIDKIMNDPWYSNHETKCNCTC
jgi:hypothetical protein